MKGVKSMSGFIFFFLHILGLFVKKSLLSPLKCLCSFVKEQLTISVWVYFWALCSIPLIYLSFIIPHCLNYYSFIVILQVSSVFLIFSLNIMLVILGFLPLHTNFTNSIYRTICWDLDWDCIYCIDQIGKN